jgi:hypothetical protein
LPKQGSASGYDATINQAYVANGMMMVVVESKALSRRFFPNQSVTAAEEISMRLGPGTNYATLATISPGTDGVIQSHNMDGVLAKGFCWWKVAFGGNIGWVKEGTLEGGELPPPPPPPPTDINMFLPLVQNSIAQGAECLLR